jgi:hypothetical protein
MSVVRFCPHLSIWAMAGILDFETFAGFSLLPLYLLLCCANCLYACPRGSVYRSPGCISAFILHLPRDLQDSEAVREVLSLLEGEGENAVLGSLAGNEGSNWAMERIVSALVENTSPASDCYLNVSEAFDFSSRKSIVNTEKRNSKEWSELPFSPILTHISMGGVERLVLAAAPRACKVGIGVYDFVLPLRSELKGETVKVVVCGKEEERVFVPCEHLKSAIT